MKLDKVKPVKQQLSSIQPEVVFLGSVVKIQKIKRTQHVLCRISYITYDIEFLHIRWVSQNAPHSWCDDSSYMREFDVITYIVDFV